jgi:dihydroxyacetone kinase-like predicted kinase
VVGDEDRLRVHVHVADPGRPLSYGATQGRLVDIVVENMDEQAENRFQPISTPADRSPVRTGTVALVNGPGLGQIVESLGAKAVVNLEREAGLNTQALGDILAELEAEQLIILPNDKALISTAQQAASLSSKAVSVLPTHDVPQGISALLSFNPELDLTQNLRRMGEAIQTVRTLVVTHAEQAARLDEITINCGDTVTFYNDELIAGGQSHFQAIVQALERLETEHCEILTIYFGHEVTAEAAHQLAQKIAEQYPKLEIDVLNGGQFHYSYLISLE